MKSSTKRHLREMNKKKRRRSVSIAAEGFKEFNSSTKKGLHTSKPDHRRKDV